MTGIRIAELIVEVRRARQAQLLCRRVGIEAVRTFREVIVEQIAAPLITDGQ